MKTFKKRAKLINAFKSKGKMLDVGCAAGYFMLVMQQVGWETFGVDLSAYATNYAREELHLKNVFTGLLEEMPLKKNYFDLITFWDVIEHLSDPLHELKIAHTLLKNNGLLIIETQNVNSILARIMGKKWHHYKMLEHLYHFSLKTLRILLLKAGFDIQKITHNCAGKYVSINFIIERCERYSKTLHKLLKNLNFLKRSNLYINSFDEMIIMAKKQKN
ncbi:MAG: class I SAM-dependent methyltransferase [bacterium]